uniref:DUF547 domain-containing protein n=1 Tax=Paramoeba aestuarina TaxID=180227 RepID=A0A7S4JJX8_9EUKA|mmetsp:Transcript_11130/g.16801  ORF Transcript_11130/g.16801 Transcript_11130/m.16801 type:complete len:526 (+) Transcript_11130:106-1683(+)|eukprot:CAMPEP_0201522758 /NCGR_PEP_ID=MMETSP0161_2-20130828/18531_1 /ASSEMBLY_ACC=CAM_ASM_000251 /TAXON_ID=180227 /ORGANISM="Neoparamoeba aestuarina, Strain SoJaBio B1-5/56/2" /LENGTH=525 /DNA_ID=CAMNT_0047921689 /DNA_START=64 /DNA_END=1641 /DNA_ORIENTATION=-
MAASYETAVALEDYTPQNDDEIALVKGEKVMIRAFNNNAHTAQGENEKGEVGWFPECKIAVQVQQVNALDFLAASMTNSTDKKQATISPRVDTSSLTEKRRQHSERLSTFLTQKPPRKLLVDKNILTQASDSEDIKVAQEAVMKEKESKRAKLEKFYLTKMDPKKKKDKDAKEMPEKELDALIQMMLDIPTEKKKDKIGFSGKVLAEWLTENNYAEGKNDVQALCNMLLNRLVIYETSDRTNTKFSPKDFYNLSCKNVEFGAMNLDKVWGADDAGDALTLSVDLLTNLMKYMQKKKLDFGNMRTDPQFVKIGLQMTALQKCNLDSLTYGSKEAFWINLYNIMVLFVYCRLCPPASRSDRQLIHDKCYFTVARAHYSLTEVRENVILGLNQFPAKDKRSTSTIDEKDKNRKALFVFGLPDGTEATPGFYVYNAATLESKLKEAAMVFLENKLVVDDTDLKIKCPRLVRTFKQFGIKDQDAIKLLSGWVLPWRSKIMIEQPGFELDIDSTSSQEPCYLFDSTVVGEE